MTVIFLYLLGILCNIILPCAPRCPKFSFPAYFMASIFYAFLILRIAHCLYNSFREAMWVFSLCRFLQPLTALSILYPNISSVSCSYPPKIMLKCMSVRKPWINRRLTYLLALESVCVPSLTGENNIHTNMFVVWERNYRMNTLDGREVFMQCLCTPNFVCHIKKGDAKAHRIACG